MPLPFPVDLSFPPSGNRKADGLRSPEKVSNKTMSPELSCPFTFFALYPASKSFSSRIDEPDRGRNRQSGIRDAGRQHSHGSLQGDSSPASIISVSECILLKTCSPVNPIITIRQAL